MLSNYDDVLEGRPKKTTTKNNKKTTAMKTTTMRMENEVISQVFPKIYDFSPGIM